MNLFRAQNPEVINYIRDRFIPDRDMDQVEYADLIKGFMRDCPDDVQVLVLWNNDQVVGFAISFVPANRKFLFMIQAWSDPGLAGTKWPKIMFGQIQAFAMVKGLGEIRAETTRNPEAFLRKWKFEPYSTVMAFRVGSAESEVQDGNVDWRGTEASIDPDEGSKSSL